MIDEMKEKYGVNLTSIQWVGANQEQVISLEEVINSSQIVERKGKKGNGNIKVYKCPRCGFILFAIPKKGKEKKYSIDNRSHSIYIVTNFNHCIVDGCSQHK